jgi:hypothetical protein
MTKEEKSRYSEPEALRDILKRVLSGQKYRLEWSLRIFFQQLGKRHHHPERESTKNHLLALRALKGGIQCATMTKTDLIGKASP